MKHPCIEFITACACCEVYAEFVKSIAPDYPEVETKVYVAGQDMDYVPKYGMVSKSTMIVNESEVITDFSKSIIREAFQRAAASGE